MDPATVRVGLGSLKTDYIILLQKIHIDPKLMVSIVKKKHGDGLCFRFVGFSQLSQLEASPNGTCLWQVFEIMGGYES